MWGQQHEVNRSHELWLSTHENKLDDLNERVTAHHDKLEDLNRRVAAQEANPGRISRKTAWQSLAIGALFGLLIGLGLYNVAGIVVSICIGFICFLAATGGMVLLFNSSRNTASAQ